MQTFKLYNHKVYKKNWLKMGIYNYSIKLWFMLLWYFLSILLDNVENNIVLHHYKYGIKWKILIVLTK